MAKSGTKTTEYQRRVENASREMTTHGKWTTRVKLAQVAFKYRINQGDLQMAIGHHFGQTKKPSSAEVYKLLIEFHGFPKAMIPEIRLPHHSRDEQIQAVMEHIKSGKWDFEKKNFSKLCDEFGAPQGTVALRLNKWLGLYPDAPRKETIETLADVYTHPLFTPGSDAVSVRSVLTDHAILSPSGGIDTNQPPLEVRTQPPSEAKRPFERSAHTGDLYSNNMISVFKFLRDINERIGEIEAGFGLLLLAHESVEKPRVSIWSRFWRGIGRFFRGDPSVRNKPVTYTHVKEAERLKIQEYHAQGMSMREISRTLHRSPKTVWSVVRELDHLE